MSGIFISYRREDSAGWTGRIFDRVRDQLGADQVFLDVDAIAPGDDFAEAIEDMLDQVHTVFVVIGPRWLDIRDTNGQRRLDDPSDYVRREVAGALERDVRVVPVLVGAATMPAESDLPEDVRALASRNALLLTDTWFDHDIAHLIDAARPAADTREAASTTPHNLPVKLASVLGRKRSLTEVTRLLSDSRLVTLTGPGGSGKTTLALEYARGAVDSFPDGAWFADLSSVESADGVASSIASALEMKERPDRSAADQLAAHLESQDALLVLDNCEHVAEAVAPLVSEILSRTNSARILATSREPLAVLGERRYPVEPLETPTRSETDRDSIQENPAVQVFVDRAASVQAGFELTDTNATDVAEICRRVDGLPLAIELAAARINILSPRDLVARLDDRFALLTGAGRDQPARQKTLEATLDWSHNLLSDNERVLFRRLAVFGGGFTIEVAEQVCSGEGLTAAGILDLVSGLISKSLLTTAPARSGRRLRYLETVGEYAAARLTESHESNEYRQRHAAYFQALALDSYDNLRGGHEEALLDRLEDEWPNMYRAIAWYSDHGLTQDALMMAASLYRPSFLRYHDLPGLAVRLETLLEADPSRTPARARALLALGTLRIIPYSTPYLEEAVELSRELGIEADLVSALNNGAMEASFTGQWDVVRSHAEELVAMNHPDPVARSGHLVQKVHVVVEVDNDPERAVPIMKESLSLARGSGSIAAVINALQKTGYVLRTAGDLEGAEEALLEASRLEDDIGHRHSNVGNTEWGLAQVALARGDTDAALEWTRQRSRWLGEFVTDEEEMTGYESGNLHLWALLATARKHYETAVTLLATRLAYWSERSWVAWPTDRRAESAALEEARLQIGDEAFQKAWDRGSTMSVDDAIALAESTAPPVEPR